MKLVFVHDHKFFRYKDQYYSTGGLSGEALKRYIDAFGNVTIVARCEEINEMNNNLTHSSIDGTNFVTVPNHKSIRSYYKVSSVKSTLINEIRSADYVISRVSTLGNLAAKIAKKYNKPYLIEVVGCTWDALWHYNIKGKIIAPISYFNQRKEIKEAPYVVYVTNQFLQKRYPTKGKSINASNVSLTNLDESVLKKRINKINNINILEKLVIGTIGAIDVRYKGQEAIIKALAKLKELGINNFEYQLVGSGDRSYLMSVAKEYDVIDQIKFLGTIPHNEIFEWLDKIDIYAQPSKTEGLPRSLIEAMSRGLLSIGTNAGGIPELLQEEFIFNKSKGNEEEIAHILKNISKDDLIVQAKRNFNASKEYEKSTIDFRRRNFFREFISEN